MPPGQLARFARTKEFAFTVLQARCAVLPRRYADGG